MINRTVSTLYKIDIQSIFHHFIFEFKTKCYFIKYHTTYFKSFAASAGIVYCYYST